MSSTDSKLELVTVREVARRCGLSEGRVYRLVREGRFPVVRIGPGTVRFDPEAVERFIAAGGTRSRPKSGEGAR
jgi:excisionase family DNA binding protein